VKNTRGHVSTGAGRTAEKKVRFVPQDGHESKSKAEKRERIKEVLGSARGEGGKVQDMSDHLSDKNRGKKKKCEQ